MYFKLIVFVDCLCRENCSVWWSLSKLIKGVLVLYIILYVHVYMSWNILGDAENCIKRLYSDFIDCVWSNCIQCCHICVWRKHNRSKYTICHYLLAIIDNFILYSSYIFRVTYICISVYNIANAKCLIFKMKAYWCNDSGITVNI